jgi:hypothetical protein
MVRGRTVRPVIVVVRQAATARAFMPLLATMRDRRVPIELFAFDIAFDLMSTTFPQARRIASFADARSHLDAVTNAAVMLTGSSEFAAEDASFWDWARGKAIPSVAFVDSWVNYYQRFSSPCGETKFDLTPDHITVVDETMQRRLVEHGCDARKIIITGNPSMDELARCGQRGLETAEHIHHEIGGPYVLFVAEPFNERVFHGGERDVLGYRESEVAAQIAAALQIFARNNKTVVRLVIKPHPRQPEVPYVPSLEQAISSEDTISLTVSQLPALDLAANAVLVVGMTSLLLYEAAIIGVPVLSYQPNRNLVSDVTDGRPGIFVVTKPDELDDAIDLLCRSRSPSPSTFDPAMATATRRFFSFLDKLSLQNDTLESHCV